MHCTYILLAVERETPWTSLLLAVKRDTPCMSMLYNMEKRYVNAGMSDKN
jgi:hypothetical protein